MSEAQRELLAAARIVLATVDNTHSDARVWELMHSLGRLRAAVEVVANERVGSVTTSQEQT